MIMLPRGVSCSSKQQAQYWTATSPERVSEMTTVSAKVSLVGNFVILTLLQVIKYCILMVLFSGDITTKFSASDESIITFYCTELKANRGKMNPFNKNIS